MPAIAWSDVSENVSPVPAWRFYVTLPTIPGMSTQGQVLSFLVQKFIGTQKGIDYEQIPFNGSTRNFATGFHTENISIQFIEDQKISVATYLRAWIDIIIDDQGNYAMPATYKMPITVESLDESGNVIATFGWNACSPTRPDPYDWDGTQTSFLTTSCSFVTDGAQPLNNGSSGSGNSGSVTSSATGDATAKSGVTGNDPGNNGGQKAGSVTMLSPADSAKYFGPND